MIKSASTNILFRRDLVSSVLGNICIKAENFPLVGIIQINAVDKFLVFGGRFMEHAMLIITLHFRGSKPD